MLLKKRLKAIHITSEPHISKPVKKQKTTMNGAGILVYFNKITVPTITPIFTKLILVKDVIETSFSKYIVAAIINQTTVALIPSSAL